MKPLQLKMTAFGPYKYTEVIDFTELEGNRLYVISGNTGAGKTTIFDGICFALYGTASGRDRESDAMLRSDFADDDTHTSVELHFELKGRTYRIFRQLGHVKKGNKTKTGDRYEFFEIVDGEEIPCVDRQIVSEINRRVEQLLGLTQDQFKQIVMLPQGEFRKLLTSETENKEDILRRLFKTEQYKHMSERLRAKKQAVEEVFQQEVHARDHYVQTILATLPKREDAHIVQVLGEEHYNMNQVIRGLEEEVAFYKKQIVLDRKKYEQASQKHAHMQKKYHESKTINERFTELQQKEEQLQQLHAQLPQYATKEKQLEKAERASKIEPYETQVEEWRREEETKEKIAKASLEQKKVADDQLKQVQATYQEEERKKTAREEVRKQLDQLNEWLPVVKSIDETKRMLVKLKDKGRKTYQELTRIQALMKENQSKIERDQDQIKQLDDAVSELFDKQQTLLQLGEQWKLVDQYMKLTEKQTTLTNDVKMKQKAFVEINQSYKKLENAWLHEQASLLADHLHDGEACPVCGSIEHPNKATREAGMVTKEQLETKKKELNEKDQLYQKAVASQELIASQIKEQEQTLASYDIRLHEASEEKKRLSNEGKRLKKEVRQLQEDRKQLAALKKDAEKLQDERKKLETKKDELDKSYYKQKTSYETTRAVYEERLQKVPEEVRELSRLESKLIEVKQLKMKMEKAWEDAQAKLQHAKEEQTKATSNVDHANKQLMETKEKRKKAEQQFIEWLVNSSFSTVDEYRRAKMSTGERQRLKEDIQTYSQRRKTVQQQVQELKQSLADRKRVDLAALEEQLAELKNAYERAFNQWNQSKQYHEEASKLITNITEANERVEQYEQRLANVVDVYDVVRGQNSQKISFERYLQIEYLEQIIDAANHRLKDLSNGQFLLIRSDRQESHGRQSGLALDVYDAYTGQTRDVKTLSGGEKFNASLCLALGMSDVIQSFQGNISIQTMFIDEGFGSLDEESLHKSIDTLIDLQQSGRTIGVISHVQDLKALFPAVLEVKKTKEGYSQTQFILK